MENKAPKEVTINEYDVAKMKKSFSLGYQYSNVKVFPHKSLPSDIKYLSENHVKELLSDKDKEIKRLNLEIARLRESNVKDTCKCDDPDRDGGYNYCYKCHKKVSDERMDEILKDHA